MAKSPPRQAPRHMEYVVRRIAHEGFRDDRPYARMITSGVHVAASGTIVESTFAANAASQRLNSDDEIDLSAGTLTLPFKHTFLEGFMPDESGVRFAIACSQIDLRSATDHEKTTIQKLADSGGLSISADQLKHARFVCTAIPMIVVPGQPLDIPPLQAHAALDPEGRLIGKVKIAPDPQLSRAEGQDACHQLALVSMLIIREASALLTHCDTRTSTIATRDYVLDTGTMKRLRRACTHASDVRFKTIVVRGVRHGQPDIELAPNEKGKMPEHIARGVWAKYGIEGRGLLFGHMRGLFWKPPHQKGHRKNGKVIHDYKLAGEAA